MILVVVELNKISRMVDADVCVVDVVVEDDDDQDEIDIDVDEYSENDIGRVVVVVLTRVRYSCRYGT